MMHCPRGLRSARTLLVCLRWGIGDLVMELPLLKALRRHVPHAHITALGAAPAVQLLEGEAWVDRIVEAQQFGIAHWGDAGDDAMRRDLVRWGRRHGFDCILDGSHAPRAARLALWSLGLPWLDTGAYLGLHDRADDPACDGLSLLTAAGEAVWGIAVESRRPRLDLRPDERAAARRFAGRFVGDAPVLGLAPMASSPLKRGAATEFARAADCLVNRHACRVLIFGGKEQDDAAAAVQRAMEHRDQAQVLEPMHLRTTAALLEQCRAVICNDTGLMHVSAAVDVPVVGLFACTSPELYLPPGGIAVERWTDPCRYLEADEGRFGVTPCVAAGNCIHAGHQRQERWADAAVAAASPRFGTINRSVERR